MISGYNCLVGDEQKVMSLEAFSHAYVLVI
jgi:hypothetical protein